jgi:hypothetical protein
MQKRYAKFQDQILLHVWGEMTEYCDTADRSSRQTQLHLHRGAPLGACRRHFAAENEFVQIFVCEKRTGRENSLSSGRAVGLH